MKYILILLFATFLILSCDAQRNCQTIRNNPNSVDVIADCQRTHFPKRLLDIVTDCVSKNLGREITLEEFMTLLCNDNPHDLPLQEDCFAPHLDYLRENQRLFTEQGKIAEDCAIQRLRIEKNQD